MSSKYKSDAASMAQVTLYQEDRGKIQLNEPGKQNFAKQNIPDSRWCMKSYLPTRTMPKRREHLIALDSHEQLATWFSMLK